MIFGETLFATSETGSIDYYTPWFPRGGNNAIFAVELIANSAAEVTITPQTKNSEQTDSSATSASSQSFTGTGVSNWEASGWTGCLELVRLKITVAIDGGGSLALVNLRVLNPSWITN